MLTQDLYSIHPQKNLALIPIKADITLTHHIRFRPQILLVVVPTLHICFGCIELVLHIAHRLTMGHILLGEVHTFIYLVIVYTYILELLT